MVWSALCKLLQKQTYDVLSHRYGTYILTGGIILVIVSGFQFGEVALEWSQEKYAAVFNSFSDNIAGRSYQSRLCLPVPIDVVYTWVNGSDPKLLADLRHLRDEMEMELNETRSSTESGSNQCPFTHCVRSKAVVVTPALPNSFPFENLDAPPGGKDGNQNQPEPPAGPEGKLERGVRVREVAAPGESGKNVTVVHFNTIAEAQAVAGKSLTIDGVNYTIQAAFYTSDWMLANAVTLRDTILMTGFPHTLGGDQLLEKMPEKFQKAMLNVFLYEAEGLAVLEGPDNLNVEDLLNVGNFSIEGKKPTLTSASLIWNMQDVRYNEEISASRFADNEELRYSLRSIETFAPWVRHVYLVTNGQIPSWLNLDSPRLTIVTHQEIFVNQSHLPAFASPAIESHLHRIPGLSNKFIYMNDDVMFGKPVWPDDFYTHAHGQKVYLTWPVPNCQEGCPSSWIRDGYCDKACNNSECEWDGGDCAGGAPNSFGDHGAYAGVDWHANNEAMYCSSGCANNWVADRYCDQACNVKECGFDAGDCGVGNFEKLLRIDVKKEKTHYTAPKGETVMYLNISQVFKEGVTLEEGSYDEDPALRTATLAQKFKTLTVLLYDKKNASVLHFVIKGKINSTEIEYSFNLSVDSTPVAHKEEVKINEEDLKDSAKHNGSIHGELRHGSVANISEAKLRINDIPQELQKPKPVLGDVGAGKAEAAGVPSKLTEYHLDEQTLTAWKQLQKEVEEGDITNKWFEIRRASLWSDFVARLKTEGKEPIRATLPESDKETVDEPSKKEVAHVGEDQPKVVEGNHERRMDKVGKEGDGGDREPENIEDTAVKRELHRDRRPGVEPPKLNPDGEQLMRRGDGGGNIQTNAGVNEKTFDSYLQNKQAMRSRNKEDFQGHQGVPGMKEQVLRFREGNGVGGAERAARDHPAGQMSQGDGRMHQGNGILEGKAQEKFEKGTGRIERQKGGEEMAKNGRNGDLDMREKGPVDGTGSPGGRHRSRKLNSVSMPILSSGEEKGEAQREDATPSERLEAGTWRLLPGEQIMPDVSPDEKEHSFLPWERRKVFAALEKRKESQQQEADYTVRRQPSGRRLLDTFGDSLRHVNRLYNVAYGYSARKVPAHMPHFIDRTVMYELQAKFPKEWDETSSHRIRSSTDMQFAFAYMYFLMSEPQPTTVGDIFDELDNDHSGVLSDRELRTMATRLFDLPLDLQTLTSLEQMFINCSRHLPSLITLTWGSQTEIYYDKDMPQVTKLLINNCNPVIDLIQKNFKGRNKYKFEIVDDSEVAFKMIHSNVSQVVGQLDDIRRNPKKFICLNDNMDHSKEDEVRTVKAVLMDFYESILPIPSSFELHREYRNRFLHTGELREWRKYRDWLKLWTQVALGVLILFTIGSFFADKITAVRRRFFRARAPSQQDDAVKVSAGRRGSGGSQAAGEGGAPGGLRPPDLVDV